MLVLMPMIVVMVRRMRANVMLMALLVAMVVVLVRHQEVLRSGDIDFKTDKTFMDANILQ
jgi:hypothetical protein